MVDDYERQVTEWDEGMAMGGDGEDSWRSVLGEGFFEEGVVESHERGGVEMQVDGFDVGFEDAAHHN